MEVFKCEESVQSLERFSWFSASVMVMNLYIAVEENLRKASTLTLSNLGAAYELVLDQNCPFTLSLPILLAIALVFFLIFHRDTSGWGSFSGSGWDKITENVWHLLLLFYGWAIVVRFYCLVWSVSRNGFYVPSFTVVVRQDCNCCRPEAVVSKMWLYPSAATHVFQHVVQRARANRRVAVPDFVICWAELLTLVVSWFLEKSLGSRVQVI